MKKLAFVILISLIGFVACAPVEILGLYHCDDCDENSSDCFQYNFHSDGIFGYWYTNSTFGEFYVTGNFYSIGRDLKLFPVKYIYHDTTNLCYSPRHCKDSIQIKISVLPGYLKNRPDTMQMPWLIKVNDDKFFSDTDNEGVYRVATDKVTSISIKEYSAKFYMNNEILKADTIIYPMYPDQDIHILLASSMLEPLIIPPIQHFKIKNKGRKLVAVPDTNSSSNPYFEHKTLEYIKE